MKGHVRCGLLRPPRDARGESAAQDIGWLVTYGIAIGSSVVGVGLLIALAYALPKRAHPPMLPSNS